MRRIATQALLVLFVLFWLANGPGNAQQAEQKKPCLLEWEKSGEGVQVLKLWESGGPKWPQIAILRLSREEYEKFRKEPVTFLNEHKVYPVEYPAKKVVRYRLAPPKSVSGEFIVVLKHDPNSTSVTTSSSNVTF